FVNPDFFMRFVSDSLWTFEPVEDTDPSTLSLTMVCISGLKQLKSLWLSTVMLCRSEVLKLNWMLSAELSMGEPLEADILLSIWVGGIRKPT
uniref:Uncharacterized protein n=1 Tax=Accipiter nisus TaxID=211598 RepID=A0A8B9M396_9AVES